MQSVVDSPQSLPKKAIATKAIVWVLFLLWTFLLSEITWEIQLGDTKAIGLLSLK